MRAITKDEAIKMLIRVYTLFNLTDTKEMGYNYWNDKSDKQIVENLKILYENEFKIVPDGLATKILYKDKI